MAMENTVLAVLTLLNILQMLAMISVGLTSGTLDSVLIQEIESMEWYSLGIR